MPAKPVRNRLFRSGLRTKIDFRRFLRGDSFFIRAAIYLAMGGIFTLFVLMAKQGTRSEREIRESAESSDTVRARPMQNSVGAPIHAPRQTKRHERPHRK